MSLDISQSGFHCVSQLVRFIQYLKSFDFSVNDYEKHHCIFVVGIKNFSSVSLKQGVLG